MPAGIFNGLWKVLNPLTSAAHPGTLPVTFPATPASPQQPMAQPPENGRSCSSGSTWKSTSQVRETPTPKAMRSNSCHCRNADCTVLAQAAFAQHPVQHPDTVVKWGQRCVKPLTKLWREGSWSNLIFFGSCRSGSRFRASAKDRTMVCVSGGRHWGLPWTVCAGVCCRAARPRQESAGGENPLGPAASPAMRVFPGAVAWATVSAEPDEPWG